MSESEAVPIKDRVMSKVERVVPDAIIRDTLKSTELIGITNNPDKSKQKQELDALDVQTLRFLHRIALPALEGGDIRVFGCLGIYTQGGGEEDYDLVDALDSSHSVQVKKGERYMGMDILPFGEASKVEKFATESLFLIATDLLRAMPTLKDKRTPSVAIVDTNPHMARFIMRNLNFHVLQGAIVKNKERTEMSQDQIAEAINRPDTFQQETLGNTTTDFIDIALFASKEDIISSETEAKLKRIQEVIYKKMTGDTSKPTRENLEKLEHDIRVLAINEALHPSFDSKRVRFNQE